MDGGADGPVVGGALGERGTTTLRGVAAGEMINDTGQICRN